MEYVESLGIELPEDSDLLFLAREGLKARLPNEWKPCQGKDGQIFYFNFETGESVWDHPCDTIYRNKVLEAKSARKNAKGKKSINSLSNKKTNNSLGFNSMPEPAENSEFNKQKKEIEGELQEFSKQLTNEYAEKVRIT
jgi:centrosomal protein CEP164